MKFRAFISADILPSSQLSSLLRELVDARADLKVVKPDLLHVTLKFLGDTDDSVVDDIDMRMRRCAEGERAFKLRLQGMGAFPSLSNIRVVWVGIQDGEPLERMASRLEESLRDLGYEPERKKFVPHLTLARARSGRNIGNIQEIIRANATKDYGEYTMDRIRLKKSVLSPQGPAYSVVREVALEP